MSPLERSFYEVFLESSLTQLISDPTYVLSGNVMDLILVSIAENVGDFEIIYPLYCCQHSPVVVETFLGACRSDQPESVRALRPWSKGNYVGT